MYPCLHFLWLFLQLFVVTFHCLYIQLHIFLWLQDTVNGYIWNGILCGIFVKTGCIYWSQPLLHAYHTYQQYTTTKCLMKKTSLLLILAVWCQDSLWTAIVTSCRNSLLFMKHILLMFLQFRMAELCLLQWLQQVSASVGFLTAVYQLSDYLLLGDFHLQWPLPSTGIWTFLLSYLLCCHKYINLY